jgi:hypothetical protein
MEIEKNCGQVFTEMYDYEEINKMLRDFCYMNKNKMPNVLIKDTTPGFIMADIMKVSGQNIFLPVIVRSTNWLQGTNRVSGKELIICLHDEMWPAQDRIELIGGLSEIYEEDFETPLIEYLKISVDYWASDPWVINATDRAKKMTRSNELKELLDKINIVELSDEYKELEVNFYLK